MYVITATGKPCWGSGLPITNIETPVITDLWTEFLIKENTNIRVSGGINAGHDYIISSSA